MIFQKHAQAMKSLVNSHNKYDYTVFKTRISKPYISVFDILIQK